jgi:hypothetical protein
MEYEEIDAMLNYCKNRVKNLSDTDKIEVLRTLCCEVRDVISEIELKLDMEEDADEQD